MHGPADGFPIERYTELVRPTLRAVDLRFANCERQYSSRGVASETSPHGRQPPEMARIFTDCGFDAVTIANNHMYDYGPDALLDTRDLLLSKGIGVTGAGRDLDEARQPAIVERNGIRVGFLGYCSVIPEGGEAAPGKVGIAPLRVKTEYEGRGPHASPRVITHPDEQDMRMILDDVARRAARSISLSSRFTGASSGCRVLSPIIRWSRPTPASMRAVDLILGHHAHVPKAIEVYKGKAIFYSLSNFCMTKPFPSPRWSEVPWAHGALRNYTEQDADIRCCLRARRQAFAAGEGDLRQGRS